ncbi:MAG: hypothetical protein U1E53_26225 [Dongiaceae bacterium]
MTITTHCQICGRAIRTVRGLIALHGHTRPHGMQTRSCLGARFRPYEEANDALPPAIARLERFIEATTAKIEAWTVRPPAEIVLPAVQFGIPGGRRLRTRLIRPAGFDPASEAGPAVPWDSYERAYGRIQAERRVALEGARGEVAALVSRLAGWVPPVEIAGRAFIVQVAEIQRKPACQLNRGRCTTGAIDMTRRDDATLVLGLAQAKALEDILTAAATRPCASLARLGRPSGDTVLERLREAWAAYGEQAAELLAVLSRATQPVSGTAGGRACVAEPGATLFVRGPVEAAGAGKIGATAPAGLG